MAGPANRIPRFVHGDSCHDLRLMQFVHGNSCQDLRLVRFVYGDSCQFMSRLETHAKCKVVPQIIKVKTDDQGCQSKQVTMKSL